MTLQEVHQVCLDILKDIHGFCIRNEIKYSLSGGSLLGAIRHNGIIPWDDDIDLQMSRPEYEKFIHTYKSEKGYKLFSRELEGCEDVEIAFARVCEMEKTHVNTGTAPWQDNPTGVWIDILPIDGAPNSERQARKRIRLMRFVWNMTLAARARIFSVPFSAAKSRRMVWRLFVKKVMALFIPRKINEVYIRMCKKYDYNSSEYIANFSTMQYGFREWQPRHGMEEFVLHEFEGCQYYIMKDFEISLKGLYGDYMKLPPEEKRKAHIANMYFWK